MTGGIFKNYINGEWVGSDASIDQAFVNGEILRRGRGRKKDKPQRYKDFHDFIFRYPKLNS